MLKKLLATLLAVFAFAAFAAVDVNKASQAELDGVKGIGPSIATKILDERKKGSFKDWQDFVDRVKGVGEGNAAKFSAEGLTVNGAAFKGVAAAPAAKKDDKPASAAAAAPATVPAKAEAAKPAATPAPAAAPAKEMTAAEKKAAAKKEKEEKAAAKKKEAEEKKAAKAAKPAAAASAAKK